jgi:nitrogen fixation/metabolism regulation signal transduction histidine kinase
MDQFNSLLRKSQKAMLCGPDCQKAEAASTLQQKYLDAQVNVQTAPAQLQDAEKKYYSYTQGDAGYASILGKESQTKADVMVKNLKKIFDENISSAKTLARTYSTQLINSQYAKEIYDKYLEENKNYKNKLQDNSYDIFTNDRKTYYEDQGIDNLKWWYYLFFTLYAILIIAYILFFFIASSNFSILARFLILLGLILYPFFFPRVFNYFIQIYYRVISVLPKNAYLHI